MITIQLIGSKAYTFLKIIVEKYADSKLTENFMMAVRADFSPNKTVVIF